MQRRGRFISIFLIFFILSFILFLFSKTGVGLPVAGFFEQMSVPLQRVSFGLFVATAPQDELSKLKEENRKLQTQLAKQKELQKENDALRDQFETEKPSSRQLLPAEVIGFSSFLPGESFVTEMLIDKGTADGLEEGDVVIYEDNVVGKVAEVSVHASVVFLITHRDMVFTVETVKTKALGLVAGQDGSGVLLGNVVLSDKLEKNDLVITKGDVQKNGGGYPPDLVVGKIISVNKKTSDLFQAAEVQSLVDFSKLKMVFVLK